MPSTVVIENPVVRCETVTDGVAVSEQDMLIFMTDLAAFNNVVPINIFTVTRTQTNPNPAYTYFFQAVDGRQWSQTLRLEGQQNSEPTMNFNVVDFWRLSEFALHRPIRDRVIEWARTNQLVSISHDWK